MAATSKEEKVPAHLKDKINPAKHRILFLSPSVTAGEEREAKTEDFQSLSSSSIGSGGFGKVYKVRHKVSQNVYAIKVISKAKVMENDLAEQITLEVKIMYQLNHPHIIKLYNHFEDDTSFYLVLEYASKGQLYTKLKSLGRLDERTTAQYVREVVSAVEYLHGLKPPIIHRDIKPENVLLDVNDAAKLCDFGWSNFFNPNGIRMTYCGTPEYLAPEMIHKAGHGKPLDVWNIGVLIYELLTGRAPFEGATQKELFENILRMRIDFPKDFPKLAKDLIVRLLRTDPQARLTTEQILMHAWLQANPPLRTVGKIETTKQADQTISAVMSYEAVSKKSIINRDKEEAKIREDLKLDSISVPGKLTNAKDATIQKLANQYQALNKELNESKVAFQLKCKELEVAERENRDIKDLIHKADKGYIRDPIAETRKVNEDVQKLKFLNRNREEIIAELEKKSALLSEQETKMKLLQNELEIERNAREMLKGLAAVAQEKTEALEKKYEAQKQAGEEYRQQKEKRQTELASKLQALEVKLAEKADSSQDTQESVDALSDLIQVTLGEIKQKLALRLKMQREEEALRQELASTYVKLAELKSKHEAEVYELQNQFAQKTEAFKEKARAEALALAQADQQQIAITRKKLQEIQESTNLKDTEPSRMQGMRSHLEQQKQMVADMKKQITLCREEEAIYKTLIVTLQEKVGDLEYQCNVVEAKTHRTTKPIATDMSPSSSGT